MRDQYTFAETARLLGVSVAWIKVREQRGIFNYTTVSNRRYLSTADLVKAFEHLMMEKDKRRARNESDQSYRQAGQRP